VSSVGLDLGTTLIFSGLYNIYSGAAFAVPIPVQPMKSIAAVAITEDGITLNQMLLAGVLVSAAVLLLGVTGLINMANRAVPESIIRGIQVGIGLKLAIKGLTMAVLTGKDRGWRAWTGVDGLLLTVAVAVYLLVTVVRGSASTAASDCQALCCSGVCVEAATGGATGRLAANAPRLPHNASGSHPEAPPNDCASHSAVRSHSAAAAPRRSGGSSDVAKATESAHGDEPQCSVATRSQPDSCSPSEAELQRSTACGAPVATGAYAQECAGLACCWPAVRRRWRLVLLR
jgi:hypothetical protein